MALISAVFLVQTPEQTAKAISKPITHALSWNSACNWQHVVGAGFFLCTPVAYSWVSYKSYRTFLCLHLRRHPFLVNLNKVRISMRFQLESCGLKRRVGESWLQLANRTLPGFLQSSTIHFPLSTNHYSGRIQRAVVLVFFSSPTLSPFWMARNHRQLTPVVYRKQIRTKATWAQNPKLALVTRSGWKGTTFTVKNTSKMMSKEKLGI